MSIYILYIVLASYSSAFAKTIRRENAHEDENANSNSCKNNLNYSTVVISEAQKLITLSTCHTEHAQHI